MIGRKSGVIILNTVIGGLLGVVAIKLTAQAFGKGIYGEVGYALGLVGLVYFVTDLGFQAAHVKRVSEGESEADCLATYGTIKLVLTALFVLIVAGLVFVQVVVRGKDFFTTSVATLLVVAFHYVTRSLFTFATTTFDARRATFESQLVTLSDNLFRTVATLIAALVFATVAGRSPQVQALLPESPEVRGWIIAHGAEILASTWLVGSLAALIVAFSTLARGSVVGRFDRRLFWRYWTFAWPSFLVSVIGTLSVYVDRIAIGYFWSENEVGGYFGVQRVTGLVDTIPAAVAVLLFPTLSAVAASDPARVRDLMTRSLRYILILSLPLTAFLWVFGKSVIAIVLTNDWQGASLTLGFLAIFTFFYALIRPYSALLSASDRPKRLARVGIVMSLVNIVLVLILVPKDIRALGIPLFGLKDLGAAIGSAAAGLAGFLLIRYEAHRIHGRIDTGINVLAHVIGGAAMLAAFWLMHTRTGLEEHFYTLAAYGVVGSLVYAGVLWLFGEITKEDVRYFWDLANPRKFVKEGFSR